MNASCALQHFCDLHGPQILLCTEAKTYAREITEHDNDDLKIFYSQYIKSENPHGKLECKVTFDQRKDRSELDTCHSLVMYIIFGRAACFHDGCCRSDVIHLVTVDTESRVVQKYAKCLCEKFEY